MRDANRRFVINCRPMSEQYLSAKQAAKILGIHEGTMREHLRRGAVPSIKIGKLWRIPAKAIRRPDLDKMVKGGEVEK